jgi:5-formyltetrahydrofolate cyclo-ligase
VREQMDKQTFRKAALQRLRGVSRQQRYIIDKQINKQLYALIKKQKAKQVMLYLPLAIEVDILPLIGRLKREGIVVLVPFMVGESFRLVKYRQPLETKKYGVKEPKFSKQFRRKRIDISVVPIVGTDTSYRRVGIGKGMYDRFIMREKQWINEIIFIQRVLCMSPDIVTNDYDVGTDRIMVGR